jgi:membrane protease YdiL (CAAX protease family)
MTLFGATSVLHALGRRGMDHDKASGARLPLVIALTGTLLALLVLLLPQLGVELPSLIRKVRVPVGFLAIAAVGMTLSRPGNPLASLGLLRFNGLGVGVALLGSLAMLVGLALGGAGSPSFDPVVAWEKAIQPGFVEEVFFRGFVFGLLRWGAGWSLANSLLAIALLFGGFHVPGAILGGNADQAIGAAAITGAGGAWFAWLYERWGRSLWVPIAAHGGMNLWWVLYQAGATAADGEAGATWGRIGAITIVTVATIRLTETSRDREEAAS